MLLSPTKNDFWFLPLGGSGEIGMNLNLYGYDEQWLMVDCGVTFEHRLGVEVVLPDPSVIIQQKKHLQGIVLTHAHEDHIGALPYLWEQFKCPLYATPFTASVIRQKLSHLPFAKDVPLIEIPLSGTQKIGHFNIEFITLTHSIPEPNALAISTPLGKIVHTGDWKLDDTPLVGEKSDEKRLTEIGDEGVLALICDSTNVFSESSAGSEQTVRETLNTLLANHKQGKIIVSCFASNIARVETIIKAAALHDRKVAVVGRSLNRMIQSAQESGYLNDIDDIINEKEASKLPRDQVLWISTGSQGEVKAALHRIAEDKHPSVSIEPGDLVLFSSRIIPGNEKNISYLQNQLARKGANIITAHEEDIHVSGHPGQADLIKMYGWVRPKMLIPVHGEYRHMRRQAELAQENGVEKATIPYNGTVLSLLSGNIIQEVHSGRLGVDGNRALPLSSPVFSERNRLSQDGMVLLTLVVNLKGQLAAPAQITLSGIAHTQDDVAFFAQHIKKLIVQAFNQYDMTSEQLKSDLTRLFKKLINKRPVVYIHWIDVK